MALMIHAHTRTPRHSREAAKADIISHMDDKKDCQLCVCLVELPGNKYQVVLGVNLTELKDMSQSAAIRIVMRIEYQFHSRDEVIPIFDEDGRKFKIALFYTQELADRPNIDDIRASLVDAFKAVVNK